MPLPLQGKTSKNSGWEKSFGIPQQGGIVFVNMQELRITISQDLLSRMLGEKPKRKISHY
jgi:hypothetical protein